jgi:DNA-binding NtrC family response regulator
MANIVVLDDILDAGILVKAILKRKGHDVLPFTEEEDALDFVANNSVDLVILDIKLKKMSGIEVLEEIRKKDKDVKVIMLTGYPTIETARQALSLGAVEYCVKPIDKAELEEKVDKVLSA